MNDHLDRVAIIVLLLVGSVQAKSGQDLAPRRPLPKTPVAEHPATASARLSKKAADVRVVVKFADGMSVRADDAGGLHSASGANVLPAVSISKSRGGSFRRGFDIDDERLGALLHRAELRSGREQPDLLGLLEVELPAETSIDERIELAEAFQSLSIVECAMLFAPMQPPGDIAPVTPLLQLQQTYQLPDPGMDFAFAVALGLRGAGVRFADVEYAWDTQHEDLVDKLIHIEPNQTPGAQALPWMDHGTAVVGVLSSVANDYGCTGMAPDADVWTYPAWTIEGGHREEDAAAAAIADSAAGDVVLLELQAVPGVPAETIQAMWLVVQVATDAGVVVVEAAGNGAQDLDSSAYDAYMSWGDSGAIIVGAGSANSVHSKLSFSSYGSRVNVQGWGNNVFTLGYGDFAQYGGDPHQEYTSDFDGTSAASALVAAAAVLIENRARQELLVPLAPGALRQLMIDTGVPQFGAKHIGPLPDLAAAIAGLPTPWLNLGLGLAGSAGVPEVVAKGSLVPVTAVEVGVQGVQPGSACWLIVGSATSRNAFKGGTLVPVPDIVLGPLAAGATGALVLSGAWPPGVSPGTSVALQWWVQDGGGPKGFAASDAVVGTVP